MHKSCLMKHFPCDGSVDIIKKRGKEPSPYEERQSNLWSANDIIHFVRLTYINQRGLYQLINDLVHDTYNNILKCLQDNTKNVAPAAGSYWALFMGASESLTRMAATDTSGILGSTGQIVMAQSLIGAIANKVMNELIAKSKITTSLAVTEKRLYRLTSN